MNIEIQKELKITLNEIILFDIEARIDALENDMMEFMETVNSIKILANNEAKKMEVKAQ